MIDAVARGRWSPPHGRRPRRRREIDCLLISVGYILAGVTPPLQEPTFLVLAALAVEPLHGYGLIQAVSELSDGRVTLRAGTLYPALDRLTAERLVELAREEVVDGRLRRYYRLTDVGADR